MVAVRWRYELKWPLLNADIGSVWLFCFSDVISDGQKWWSTDEKVRVWHLNRGVLKKMKKRKQSKPLQADYFVFGKQKWCEDVGQPDDKVTECHFVL